MGPVHGRVVCLVGLFGVNAMAKSRPPFQGMVDLAPGIAVTVDVKSGSGREIEQVRLPLLRYKQESPAWAARAHDHPVRY